MFNDDFNDEEINIPELVEKLKLASHSYYSLEESIISDEEFDKLKDLLKQVDPNNKFLFQIGSPVLETTVWKKVKHKIPMGSLNKVNTDEEFKEWLNKFPSNTQYIITPKYDGLSLNCEYENGKLSKAISRGAGEEGEDYYNNAIKVKNLPKQLKESFTGSLRGEIVIDRDDFIRLNEESAKNGDRIYKNPRNACSIIRRFDGKYSEFLSIVFYNCVEENNISKFKSLEEELKYIDSLGAKSAYFLIGSEQDMMSDYYEFETHKREEFNYDLDGMVIFPNDNQIINQMGETYGNRTACIAWKFGKVIKQSTVKNVRWDMGKTGSLTPVVEIEPIRLLGTDVKSVNIYNLDYFKEYQLGLGDVVKVFKANDIIPKIDSVVEHVGKKFKMIPNCPTCGNETEESGKFLVCSNEECESKYLGNLNKYVEVLEIMNISEGIIEKLYDDGILKYPQDFYSLSANQFKNIEGLGEKSYTKIMVQFMDKKEIELPLFIGSLNILQISTKIVEKIYNAGYDSLEKMYSLTEKELVQIKGLKEKTANKFIKGLQKKKNIIDGLLKAGITIKKNGMKVVNKVSNHLDGLTYCFTGAINEINPETNKTYKREELQKMVSERGGINHSSVTKNTNYLVQASPDSSSSKSQKAIKLGCKILGEKEFFKMLGG